MAILSSFPGLEVWINVDGKPAAEYDDPDNEVQDMDLEDFDVPPGHDSQPPCIIKYIKVKHGAPFSFHHLGDSSVKRSGQRITANYWIDGTRTRPAFDRQHALVRAGAPVTSVSAGYSGNRTDGYQRHSFVFSPLEIVETGRASDKDAKNDMKHCGVLRVAFSHILPEPRRCFQVGINPHGGNDGQSGAHRVTEKTLKGKALDCKTTYVPAPDPSRRTITTYQRDYIDPRKRPFAVFEFRYRSKEGLIKEGIVPRPAVTDEVDSMTEAEVRRRLAELMEAQNQSSNDDRVKQEGAINITSVRKTESGRGIKREGVVTADRELPRTRYKTRRLDDGRVEVDLTDD